MTKAMFLRGVVVLAVLTGFWALGCGPKYPNCDDDENCKEHNEYCVDQLCRECKTTDNCVAKTNDKCKICSVNYTCVKEPGCCHNDLDCPGGKCWKAEGEETGRCGGECKSNEHCPEGKECVGERCVAKAVPCGGSCPAGKKCQDNVCVWVCDMQNVYFDFNESKLTTEARKILQGNLECLKTLGTAISVEGNCDERGTEEYNLALGQRRADVSKKFLKDKGAKNEFSTISYGEEKPVCSDSAESCWWRNRRAELKPKD
jgi:peptidoglycan-associated lipoprotein